MQVICFDFDDVIVDGNLVFRLIKLRPEFSELELGFEFMFENQKPKEFYKVIKKIVKVGKGLGFDEIKKIMFDFEVINGTKRVFKKLKENYKIVIVSANDTGMIKEFLKKHKLLECIDRIYGSKLGVKNGRLTGKISGDVIMTEKTAIVKNIEKAYRIKRKDITYIGDGLTDLPIIKMVGKGILFCPSMITQAEVFRDKILSKMEKDGKLFLIDKKDLSEILRFV